MLDSVANFSFDAILERSSFGANSRCRPLHSSFISVHLPIQYHMRDYVPPMFRKGVIFNALPITIQLSFCTPVIFDTVFRGDVLSS